VPPNEGHHEVNSELDRRLRDAFGRVTSCSSLACAAARLGSCACVKTLAASHAQSPFVLRAVRIRASQVFANRMASAERREAARMRSSRLGSGRYRGLQKEAARKPQLTAARADTADAEPTSVSIAAGASVDVGRRPRSSAVSPACGAGLSVACGARRAEPSVQPPACGAQRYVSSSSAQTCVVRCSILALMVFFVAVRGVAAWVAAKGVLAFRGSVVRVSGCHVVVHMRARGVRRPRLAYPFSCSSRFAVHRRSSHSCSAVQCRAVRSSRCIVPNRCAECCGQGSLGRKRTELAHRSA